jgi:hypothetical protein
VERNPAWLSYAENINIWMDPPAIAAIHDQLPRLADEIVDVIQEEVAEYSDTLRGDFGQTIRLGTEQALRRFIGEGDDESPAVYRALGYGEHRSGRSLDALQSAYRIGARVAWRRMSTLAAEAGASTAAQHHLAEAMFAYIDQLASESVDGYAAAQMERAGDIERRRATLLALLLGAPAGDPEQLAAAASAARWPLPRRLACVALDGEPGPLARRLSGDTLYGEHDGAMCVVVPDPSGLLREAALAAKRLGARVGVGPTVDPLEAPRSLRWAALAVGLAAPAGAVRAEDRLADLALGAAPEIARALRSRALAPLAGETAASRLRLEATLRAWMRHRGSQGAIARELSVHPQTVRYRVRRLRELFGEALADPERRFELEVALRTGPAES